MLQTHCRLDGSRYRRDEGGGDQQTECAICLDDFEEDAPVVSLQCEGAHTFHKDCINTWLSHEGVCPLCKFELPTAPVGTVGGGRRVLAGAPSTRAINTAGEGPGGTTGAHVRVNEAVAGGEAEDLDPELTLQLGQRVDLGGLSWTTWGWTFRFRSFCWRKWRCSAPSVPASLPLLV